MFFFKFNFFIFVDFLAFCSGTKTQKIGKNNKKKNLKKTLRPRTKCKKKFFLTFDSSFLVRVTKNEAYEDIF